MIDDMNNFHFPIEILYGVLALFGGIARYLNGFVNGQKFKMSIFVASSFVSGFGGFMFALLGDSMSMPPTMLYIMAGVGGFFSDQALKFTLEFVTKKSLDNK